MHHILFVWTSPTSSKKKNISIISTASYIRCQVTIPMGWNSANIFIRQDREKVKTAFDAGGRKHLEINTIIFISIKFDLKLRITHRERYLSVYPI
jgi:hypothetical protein